MRLIATLIIVVLAGLPALFAGWPAKTPASFSALWNGVPGSIVVMSLMLLAFVFIAAICGVIARNARALDREVGQ